jgi:hypothetical protein
MTVERPDETVDARITSEDGEVIILEYASPGAQTTLKINLALDALHILELNSRLNNGKRQNLKKQ